jgi:type I restriction enzyme S subunit
MDQLIKYPKHEEYKPSGVEWLGDIPAHWSIEPIRAVTQLKSEKNQPDLQVLSVYREYGVIPKDSRDDNHNATSLDTSGYKVVNEGDLVVNKMKAWQGSMGVSEHRGIVSPAYITCSIDSDRVSPQFLHYLLRSRPYIGVYNALSYGVRVGQWDMHYEDFKRIPLPLPAPDEQQRIASFLDQKTAEIDEAISKKQSLIGLLNEQKAILISQAVTKGLNPNIPMRDSGVDWVGQIPEHWEALRLKNVAAQVKTGRTPPSNLSVNVFMEGTIDWFTPSDFREGELLTQAEKKINYFPIRKKYVDLYPENSMYFIGIGGTLGKVSVCKESASCNQQINVISFNEKMLSDYCMYLYQCWRQSIFGLTNYTTMPILNQSGTKNLPVLVPPIEEQEAISAKCKALTESYEQVNGLIEKQIESLVILKQVMVSHAITGKIKV